MTEQEKREKVIRGLECCNETNTSEVCPCPYQPSHKSDMCLFELHADALALLKAHEPRVLSIQEIHRGMAVWLEDIDKEDVILAIGGSSCGGAKCFISEKNVSVNALDVEYNTRWRAWTDEPTTAQREAVKWD